MARSRVQYRMGFLHPVKSVDISDRNPIWRSSYSLRLRPSVRTRETQGYERARTGNENWSLNPVNLRDAEIARAALESQHELGNNYLQRIAAERTHLYFRDKLAVRM